MRSSHATHCSLFVALSACLAASALTPVAAAAQQPAAKERIDPRIRVIPYNANRIISLRGHLGYQMLIEFEPDERIENVALGDSQSWQVTPNRAATMLFLKPVAAGSATNMTVVTSLRRYAFDLRSEEPSGPTDPNIIYAVRFTYPKPPPPPVSVKSIEPSRPPGPTVANANYAIKGADRFEGVRIFDDGRSTYFLFPPDIETPAIFLLNARNDEELVNSRASPPYIVVDHLSPAFMLRSGRLKARVTNGGFRATAAAPKGSTP